MKYQEVTEENWVFAQKDFLVDNPGLWVMIRPDRYFDLEAHRYPDGEARSKGTSAMKVWFEYLAGKKFFKIFRTWRGLLKAGRSIMAVCSEPLVFDPQFVPPVHPVLPADFWREFELSRVPIDHRHSDEMRKLTTLFHELAADMRMGAACAPVGPPVLPLREYQSTPLSKLDASKPLPKLSPAALAAIKDAR